MPLLCSPVEHRITPKCDSARRRLLRTSGNATSATSFSAWLGPNVPATTQDSTAPAMAPGIGACAICTGDMPRRVSRRNVADRASLQPVLPETYRLADNIGANRAGPRGVCSLG